MSDIMGMGGMDPETAMAMDMMMGAPMPSSGGLGTGLEAPCTICGAIVPVDSGAPVEGMGMGAPGMGGGMDGMGMDMGGGMPPMPPMM
jgi:hypothetical protein